MTPDEKRAKKIGMYLQDKFGWTVFEASFHECCGRTEFWDAKKKFCPFCGKKLRKKSGHMGGISEIAEALQHADKQTKKRPE